jgi:hypothetical protein
MKITKISTKFYVYVHTNPSNGKVFYVGKGSSNRAYQTRSRNDHWKNTVNKYGINVSIVKNNMTNEEAASFEMWLISFYGMENLCNMTAGGEGCISLKQESKDKMAIAKIGNKNALGHSCNNIDNKERMKHFGNKNMLGKKHSEKTKALISKNNIGKIFSAEARKKQSESLKLAYKEGRMYSPTKGKPAWNKGLSPSKETLEKQRLKKIGVKRKPHSQETKEKMRLAALNRKQNGYITTSPKEIRSSISI